MKNIKQNIFIVFLLWLCCSFSLLAQVSKPVGVFAKDSAKVGQELKFIFSYHHSKNDEVAFPDTNYNFAPFELIRKRAFPTVTQNQTSVDSVIYYLRTFSVEPQLSFSLPVMQLSRAGDSTFIYSDTAYLYIKQMIQGDPQTYFLKDNIQFQSVKQEFNYLYYLIFGLGTAILILALVFLFRRNLIRRYRLFMLRRAHLIFMRNFERLERKLQQENNLSELEIAVSEWKLYLSKLENSPINTFTTTEIITLFENQELAETLQNIDRSIYGGVSDDNPIHYFAELKKFANQRFQRRKKEVRNA